MTEEVWKEIPGCEGMYAVSNMGRVKRLRRVVIRSNGHRYTVREAIKKPTLWGNYLYVAIKGAGFVKSVHTLVLITFVGPCPPGKEACHYNGIFTDNRLENLRWDTRKGNKQDDIRNGRYRRGEAHPTTFFTDEHIVQIFNTYASGNFSMGEIARSLNVSTGLIQSILQRETWGHVEISPLTIVKCQKALHIRPRSQFGEKHRDAKMTKRTVRQARKLHAAGKSIYSLAKKYNVDPSTMANIVHRKTWKHVD